jgi:hypothetical protein
MFERTHVNLTTNQKMLIAGLLVLFILLGRLLPHMWNMTPVVGATLFAGVYLGKRYALAIPAIAMLISDMFIGFYDIKLLLIVYASFALVGLFGWVLKKSVTVANVLLGSVVSSTIFFLITNWAVWQFSAWYPQTFVGLMQSYAMGVPFFKNALIGDVVYTGIFFGAYALATRVYLHRAAKAQKCYVINN